MENDFLQCSLGQLGNPFFDAFSPCRLEEQALAGQIAAEAVNQKGFQAAYIALTWDLDKKDLWHEDSMRKAERAFFCMAYSDKIPSASFSEGLMGLFSSVDYNFTIARAHFSEASKMAGARADVFQEPMEMPRIGDLLWVPQGNGMMLEIISVMENEQNFQYQSSVWVLGLKQFKRSHCISGATEYLKGIPEAEELLAPLWDVLEKKDSWDIRKEAKEEAEKNRYIETAPEKNAKRNLKESPFGRS